MLGTPCVTVSSLEALAMNAVSEAGEAGEAGENVLVRPMLDARRSQVYAGGYFLEDGWPVEKIKAGPYMLDEFLQKAQSYDSILLMGDAMDTYAEKIAELRPEGTETASADIKYQDAVTVARLGAKIYAEKAQRTIRWNRTICVSLKRKESLEKSRGKADILWRKLSEPQAVPGDAGSIYEIETVFSRPVEHGCTDL